MINKNGNHNDFLNLLVYRNIMGMAKIVLTSLDEFKNENLIGEDYFQKERKRILTTANDKIREFQETIAQFNFKLK